MLGISTSKCISQSKWQRRTLNKFLCLALVALILPSGLFAQEENGASLIIRFADGASRFHVGEIIPIELSFRACIPEMYDMSTANYDRSGRLNIEQYGEFAEVRYTSGTPRSSVDDRFPRTPFLASDGHLTSYAVVPGGRFFNVYLANLR
jgi:hypothetical protein